MDKGWLEFREINRVVYDPKRVSVATMVEWLKKAGTYRKTLEDRPLPEDPRK